MASRAAFPAALSIGFSTSSFSRNFSTLDELEEVIDRSQVGGLRARSKTHERLDHLLASGDLGLPRRCAIQALRSSCFDMAISTVILLNIVIMILDANSVGECAMAQRSDCELRSNPVTDALEYVFLAIYTLELALRAFAERMGFFQSKWNTADGVVVLVGLLEALLSVLVSGGEMLSLLQVLKIFRVTRIVRAIRLLRFFPHLLAMVQGFIHAVVAMGWGFIMIVILLIMISVIAVEIVAPKNVEHDLEWCTEAFGSVWNATMYFFQITVAGDSWGACAIPIMREHFYTFTVFVGAVCTIELGFMNLILSAIIQTAHEAQENDMQEKKQQTLRRKHQSAVDLLHIFREIDRDGSGTLSYEELLAAYDDKDGKANSILTVLDVGRNDLPELFRLMDTDNSDAIGHREFVECIRKAQVQDIRIQMLTMKLQLDRLARSIGTEVRRALRECGSPAASAGVTAAGPGSPSGLDEASMYKWISEETFRAASKDSAHSGAAAKRSPRCQSKAPRQAQFPPRKVALSGSSPACSLGEAPLAQKAGNAAPGRRRAGRHADEAPTGVVHRLLHVHPEADVELGGPCSLPVIPCPNEWPVTPPPGKHRTPVPLHTLGQGSETALSGLRRQQDPRAAEGGAAAAQPRGAALPSAERVRQAGELRQAEAALQRQAALNRQLLELRDFKTKLLRAERGWQIGLGDGPAVAAGAAAAGAGAAAAARPPATMARRTREDDFLDDLLGSRQLREAFVAARRGRQADGAAHGAQPARHPEPAGEPAKKGAVAVRPRQHPDETWAAGSSVVVGRM